MNGEKREAIDWATIKLNYAIDFVGQGMRWLPDSHSLKSQCEEVLNKLISIEKALDTERKELAKEQTK